MRFPAASWDSYFIQRPPRQQVARPRDVGPGELRPGEQFGRLEFEFQFEFSLVADDEDEDEELSETNSICCSMEQIHVGRKRRATTCLGFSVVPAASV